MTDKEWVSKETLETFRQRGYDNADVLPKPKERRNMNWVNYFTLWMGSIHNIPNYAAVGGFLGLAVAPYHIMLALVLSGLAVATFLAINGQAGTKYGIPFAMHLRSAYGVTGAKIPGFLRGVVAAIAWFGLQNYTGSVALLILISKIWPGFAQLGGGMKILGITIPGLISFTLFFLVNVLIGLGGGEVLNKFTGILTPIIYIVFGASTFWALKGAGGLGAIMAYQHPNPEPMNLFWVYLMVISSVLAVWAAPGVSVADFTQNAKSQRDQQRGQYLSLFVGYAIFALTSVIILVGGSIIIGQPQSDVLDIINSWASLPAIGIATSVFLLTTISTNATGNIIPAGYQLSALFPKQITYKKGILIAGLISYVIMPWKMMAHPDSILVFLDLIGVLLGPVAGVLVADYYMVKHQQIDLDALYMDPKTADRSNPYVGVRKAAYVSTIVGLLVALLGKFIPALAKMSKISWLVGFAVAFACHTLISQYLKKKHSN